MQISPTKTISLWLIPPEPLLTELSSIQSQIIKEEDRQLPSFIPHVTLIGGVKISDCCTVEEIQTINLQTDTVDTNADIDDIAAQVVLQRLQRAFQSYGGVVCHPIKEKGVFAERQWNQSCICLLERNDSIMNAMQTANDALFSSSSTTTTPNSKDQSAKLPIERHFKPPVNDHHYSFAYGNSIIPPSVERPPTFTCTEMVLMWTYPATLDGVKEWAEIGRVNLI